MDRKKVLVVEDHGIVRDGIRLLLQSQPDLEVVAEASDGLSAVELAVSLRPDIVLMDLGLPGLNGTEAMRQIHEICPDVKLLALTVHDSDDYFFRTLRAGASGYILKGASSSELLGAIRSVFQGEIYLNPSFNKRLVSDYLRRVRFGEEQDSYASLTEREREVLRLFAEGYSNQEVACKLTVSPSTVQTHLRRVMEKLNLQSRADLIKYAIRRGIIDLDS